MTDAIREAVKDIKFYLDRIEELTNRNKELEAALREIAETPDHYTPHMVRTHARAALGEKKDGEAV